MTRRLLLPILLLVALLPLGWQTIADAQEEDEKSRFVRFVERQISTPDRQIRLGRIDGALSSDVTISEITISDRTGVWLTIEDAHLVWSRLALLRGQLDVDLLEAERIEIARRPNAPEEETPPEAEFEIPELPVGVDIDKLSVPRIDIAAGVIGPEVSLATEGELHLNDGSLVAKLDIDRLDKPGELSLAASFSNVTRVLELDLQLSEPEDGVVANALNIVDRPAIAFAIQGSGPLDDFAAEISLAADGEELVDGTTTISRVSDGLRFVAELGGNLRPLVPPIYADLVAGGSQLSIDATRTDAGAISLARAELRSGAASLTASAEVTADGFPTALDVDVQLGSESGDPVNLPGGGGAATVRSGTISITLGGAVDNTWVATFDLQDLQTPIVSAEQARIMGSGLATDMANPDARRVTFELQGSAEGLGSEDPDVRAALGRRIALQARGAWEAGQPVDVQVARIENPNALASFEGEIGEDGLDGAYTLRASNLALFSGLVGQDLGGSADVSATGTIALDGSELALQLQGRGEDLELGVPVLDGLFAGETRLSGGVGRSRTGFRFEELRLANPQATARLHGAYGTEEVNLSARAELEDVEALTDRATGPVELVARLAGTSERPELEAAVTSDRLMLAGRPLTGLRAEFMGTLLEGTQLNGDLSVAGSFDGVPLDVSAQIASLEDGTRTLQDFAARAGRTTAGGRLTLRPDGLYEGEIEIDSPDLAAVAPLFLMEAEGSLSADVALAVVDGGQSSDIEARARDLRLDGIEVGAADIDLEGTNLLTAPILSGDATASAVRVGEFVIDDMRVAATREGDTTNFEVDAELSEGRLVAAGSLVPVASGFDLTLASLRLTHRGIEAELERAARLAVRDGAVTVEDAALQVGGGGLEVSGTVGETLDLSARVNDLPLSIGNAFVPDLDLAGTLSGRIEATGTTASPVADFQVSGRGIAARPLRQAGVAALDVEAAGTYRDGTAQLTLDTNIGGGTVQIAGSVGETLDVTARIVGLPLSVANTVAPDLALGGTLSGTARATGSLDAPRGTFSAQIGEFSAAPLRQAGIGPLAVSADGSIDGRTVRLETASIRGGGILVTASGTVPLDGNGLDLRAELQNLPLAAADAIAPELGLQGSLTGTVTATGSFAEPRAVFNIRGQGVSAAPLREAGIGALAVSADGRFENQTVTLVSATAEGGGLVLRAQGRVPLSGGGLDVAVDGSVPLTLSDRFLAERGARLSGRIDVDARVTGSAAAPRFSGALTADGVAFADPESGLRLTNIRLRAVLDGERLVVNELSAALGDGSVTVTGSLGIAPGGGFPADLRIALRQARYEDPQLIAATVNGDLTLRGPLLGQPVLAGQIFVERAEITVPERFGGNIALIDVRHVNAPADVLRTLEKAGIGEAAAAPDNTPSGITLDIAIDAPARIFVRGRGLDAELGGSLRIRGPVSDLSPVGAFEMIRGRIDILGQRITFDRGTLTLFGDLDPYLDFQATTRTSSVTVILNVEGRASDPQISFSSDPDLPEDEILAQLLFGRSINDLSPFQIAQLAAAAAQLAGGGGPGILEQLRVSTGLDNLDIVSTPEGGTAVQAGRYIDENIYLGVTAGEEQSGVSVNLDITDNLKVKAEAGTSDSSIGLFYEKEY